MSGRPAGGSATSRAARALALGAALAASLALAPRVRAQTRELPADLRTVAGVRFEGLRHLGSRPFLMLGHRQLKGAGLRTRPPSSLPWRERPLLRRDYLRADSAAIVSFYRHSGYLDAAVHVELQHGKDPHAAIVVFHVREGGLTRVSRVDLSGVHVYTENEVRHALQAQPGRAYDPAFLQLDVLKLRTLYQERGYSAVVDTASRRGVPDSAHVAVHYLLDEGPQYRVGTIVYETIGKLRENLGRRELLLKTGDVFRLSRLDLSKEHMNSTGLFRQVQVTTVFDTTTHRIDLHIRTLARPPRWIDIGVGSGTSDRLITTAQWGHRNLDTRALGGVLDGDLAWYGDGRPHKRAAAATLTQPWLLGVRLLGQAGVFYREFHDRAYNNAGDNIYTQHSDSRGYNFSLFREFSRISRLTLLEQNALVHQRYSIDAPLASVPDSTIARLESQTIPRYRTNTLRATLERDTRDTRINPGHGSYQTLVAEYAGGPLLKGQTSYNKVILSSTWYTPQSGGRVFAVHVTGGVMAPFGATPANFAPDLGADPEVSRVPLESRFFIGGVNSLRGYNENAVPQNGGLVMGLVNLELRVPLAGPFGVEFFLDAGNVWAQPQYIHARDLVLPWQATRVRPGDLRYAYGVGGRLVLPFGPLRIDLSRADRPDFPFTSRRGHNLPFTFQFAIGPSF